MQTTVKDLIEQLENLIQQLHKQYEYNIIQSVSAVNYKDKGWTIEVRTKE